MAHAPIDTPDGKPLTVLELTEISTDLDEQMRPDYNLVSWLNKLEKEAVERMCADLEDLSNAYCQKVTPVRPSCITTLKKKYVLGNNEVRL